MGAQMEAPAASQIRIGDMVRYVGQSRQAGFTVVTGTLGSVVAGPAVRRIVPGAPPRVACQVLFGGRSVWVPVEWLGAEWSG
jgi:hypothetical protein